MLPPGTGLESAVSNRSAGGFPTNIPYKSYDEETNGGKWYLSLL